MRSAFTGIELPSPQPGTGSAGGYAPLVVWLRWRFVELLLVAAESDQSGTLPPVTQLAWRLRVGEADLLKSLRSLREIGVVCQQGGRWKVTNFEKRQAALSGAERVQQHRGRQGREAGMKDVTKSYRERVTDSSSLSSSDSGGEGAGRGGKPSPRSAADALAVSEFLDQGDGRREAQSLLLGASSLAALPPSEYPRVEQVRAMITTYGAEKTLAELRAQRTSWCKTRGRNGRFYSPLNMGWVDRADAALAAAGEPEEEPYDPYAPLKRYLERQELEGQNAPQDESS
jgi:hypothetical protein